MPNASENNDSTNGAAQRVDDGGPAFPFEDRRSGITFGHYGGITKRDYFATHAPTAPEWWISRFAEINQTEHCDVPSTRAEAIAVWNYLHADAMLKARKVHP